MTLVMTSALLAASSAVAAGTTCPPGEPCVVVTIVGGADEVHEFSLADFDAAAKIRTNQTYDYRGSPSTNYPSLLPVRDLLDQLGTPPDSVAFVEVGATTAAPRSTLLGDDGDLDDPGPFAGGQVPAIYTVTGSDGQRFGYTRGQHGSSDSNGDDTIVTTGDLQLTVHTTGKALRPVVTATPQSQPTANLPVTFSVDVEDAPGLRYDWSFGDGSTLQNSTDASPTHQYARTTTSGQDSFTARVTVTASDTSVGSSRPVTITIGTPTPATGGKPGTGSDPNQDAPATGPDRSKGDTQGSAPSDTSGGTGSGGGSSEQPQAPTSVEAPTAAAPPEPDPVSDGLVEVSGTLLGAVDSRGQVVPTPEQVAAARTAAAARQAAAQPHDVAWGVLIGGLTLASLLGLGAATESAWLRRHLVQMTGHVRR